MAYKKKKCLYHTYFFADDILLFMKLNKHTPEKLKEVLENFCKMSGQKINDSKSVMTVNRNCNSEEREELQHKFKIQMKNKIGKYLGIPIDLGTKMKEIGNQIIDRIQSKLQNWKGKLLSQVGKLTLIKSVMQAMPIYTMSIHLLPKDTCN